MGLITGWILKICRHSHINDWLLVTFGSLKKKALFKTGWITNKSISILLECIYFESDGISSVSKNYLSGVPNPLNLTKAISNKSTEQK